MASTTNTTFFLHVSPTILNDTTGFIVTNNRRDAYLLSAWLYGASGKMNDNTFFWTRCSSYLKYRPGTARQCIVKERYFSASANLVPRVSPGAHPLAKSLSTLRMRLSRTQNTQAFGSAGGPQERLWRLRKNLNFLIGYPVTACIISPQKSCGNKIPVPQNLS